MISVKDNYKLLNDLLSKNNGQYISPEEYGRYATLASNELFDELRGNKNQNRSTYGRNRTLDARLNPFKKNITATFAAGLYTKPTDLVQITALYTSTFIPVKPVDEDRIATLMNDPLASPNATDKYYVEEYLKLRLLTDTALVCTIEYLAKPATIIYAYTVVGRSAVFNQTGTVDFEWDKNMEMELTTRILGYMGLSMKDGFITQVSNNNLTKE